MFLGIFSFFKNLIEAIANIFKRKKPEEPKIPRDRGPGLIPQADPWYAIVDKINPDGVTGTLSPVYEADGSLHGKPVLFEDQVLILKKNIGEETEVYFDPIECEHKGKKARIATNLRKKYN